MAYRHSWFPKRNKHQYTGDQEHVRMERCHQPGALIGTPSPQIIGIIGILKCAYQYKAAGGGHSPGLAMATATTMEQLVPVADVGRGWETGAGA